jgi:hypothetical protein
MTCVESRQMCLGYTQPSTQRSDSVNSSARRSSNCENDDDDSNSPHRTNLDSRFPPLHETRKSDSDDQARTSHTQWQSSAESTAYLSQAAGSGRNWDSNQTLYYSGPSSDSTFVSMSPARDADTHFRDFGPTATEPASTQFPFLMKHQRRSTTSFSTTSFVGESPTSNPTATASNTTPFKRDAY